MDTSRPVRLIVTDDLHRSRATVFFRLLLVIPAWIVYAFWALAAILVVVAAWFVLLVRGRCSDGLHEFLAAFVRYSTQVTAYIHLAAEPYPGFAPKRDYPVRVEIDGPTKQPRWSVFFRIFLAVPALVLSAATGGGLGVGAPRKSTSYGWSATSVGAGAVAAFLGWFACLARGRMPRGLRDLATYGIGYSAQMNAYVLLLTNRYPSSDPRLAGPMSLPGHAVELDFRDDLTRPRLIVLFRLLLALPHLVWLGLWTVLAVLAVFAGWLVSLFLARLPRPLHRFLAAYVRYSTHVTAFLYMTGGPFPGFVGAAGSYPVDVRIDPPARQGRWSLAFRGFLAVPAFIVSVAYDGTLFAVGVLGWFSALARGRMPEGLTNLGAVSIRYQAQTWSYALLLTARYPYAAPALEDGQRDELAVLEFGAPPEPLEAV